MKKLPKIFIVTPVFNGISHTLKFLESLQHQSYRNFTTVIVDDGSTDGTAEQIRANFPEVVVLQGDGTLWWSGGTNLGVGHALMQRADYVLTINNDVTLPDNYIESLLAQARRWPQALIGSMVLNKDQPDKVWYCGAYFDRRTGEMMHHSGQRSDFPEPIKSEWLTGMGVLVPAGLFFEIGLYNQPEFPQYFGDSEFSVRAKRHGYELIVSPTCEVYSDVGSSWVQKQLRRPRLSFLPQLFLSIRSPYHLKTRIKFYQRYWPTHYRSALLRLYAVTMLGIYLDFLFALFGGQRPEWTHPLRQARKRAR